MTNETGVEEGISTIAKQDILLGNDQQISFYRLKDASFSDIDDLTDSRFEFFKFAEEDLTDVNATLTTESGLKLTLTDSQTSQSVNDLIGNLQSTGAPIFDFSSLPSSLDGPLGVSVELAREATYNSTVGFYLSLIHI